MTGINLADPTAIGADLILSMHVRFILLQTSHAGNVGAVARAMKVMGFDDLVLVQLGYLDPQAPRKLMPRLQQLFHRAELRQEEIHILRGIARAMQKTAAIPKP